MGRSRDGGVTRRKVPLARFQAAPNQSLGIFELCLISPQQAEFHLALGNDRGVGAE
jgi:hypothetical protein